MSFLDSLLYYSYFLNEILLLSDNLFALYLLFPFEIKLYCDISIDGYVVLCYECVHSKKSTYLLFSKTL